MSSTGSRKHFRWRRGIRAVVAAVTALALSSWSEPAAGGDSAGPLGFAPGSREPEARAEAHALAVPSPEKARAWLRTLTEEPHVAGTPADHETALFVRDKLREWGWQADLAEYEVLLNYPDGSSLEMTRPRLQPLKLGEEPLATDKDSASPKAFTGFHGYGVSGLAEGQVVYANYARPEDFAALKALGVDVKDRIVLARYGQLFRGLKVRNAQKNGAKGILIYSDPADDGYAKGDVYPDGPYRPHSAVQRGSVQFLSLAPGDPSTPGVASVKDAKRLPIDPFNGFTLLRPGERPSFPPISLGGGRSAVPSSMTVEEWEKAAGLVREDYFATIPSLPISYDSARPILQGLGGPNVPGGWQGGLPFAYHVGPGAVEVALRVGMDYKVRTIWNVIATLRGAVEPDRWVMIGNHRDAWVYGAVDPGSGTAATLEMARALGSAVKEGWKPRRSILYASWDAEEYGLVGSTEWAEEHAKALDEKVVLLLNVDSAVAGPDIDIEGVPSLRDLVVDAMGAVTEVRSGRSLRQVWLDQRRASWAASHPVDLPDPDSDDGSTRPPTRFSAQMGSLGSGSDYTVFVDHLGLPAVDIGFSGRYGVYHSVYDSFTWMEKFGDPEFVTHAMAARLYTAIAMRAAAAEVVPLTFVPYAQAIRDQLDDLRRIVERKARAAKPDDAKPPLTIEGLPGLLKSVRAFETQAAALDRATEALASRDGIAPDRLAKVNDALTRVERSFLLPDGLPGRPWFKHAIYAPGVTTGYAAWTLPGVRQAILEDDSKAIASRVDALVTRLGAATDALRAATKAAEAEVARNR